MDQSRPMRTGNRVEQRHQQLFGVAPAQMPATALQKRFERDGFDITVNRINGIVGRDNPGNRKDLLGWRKRGNRAAEILKICHQRFVLRLRTRKRLYLAVSLTPGDVRGDILPDPNPKFLVTIVSNIPSALRVAGDQPAYHITSCKGGTGLQVPRVSRRILIISTDAANAAVKVRRHTAHT